MPKSRRKFTKERPPDPESLAAPWRLFVAVPLPDPVKDLVAKIIAELEPEDWPIRWVNPDLAHITLQFIGEVPRERAELLRMALPPVVSPHERFRLRTANLGAFPNVRRPRVLWLGTYGPNHRLESLQRDVTETLRELEFPVDDKPFHPHITLGRIRDTPNLRLRDLPGLIRKRTDELMAAGIGSAANPVPLPVEEVILMRSILGPGGPQYVPVETMPLAPKSATKPEAEPHAEATPEPVSDDAP